MGEGDGPVELYSGLPRTRIAQGTSIRVVMEGQATHGHESLSHCGGGR